MFEEILQIHFIDRIARTLGEPPKDRDWARDLAEKLDGTKLSVEQIETAADALVDTGGKTFPGFARCLEALKGMLVQPVAHSAAQHQDTFHERAARHVKARGGVCHEIGRMVLGKERQAEAWRVYFEVTGYSPFLLSRLVSGNSCSLPADWPWEFDASAPRSFSQLPEGVEWSKAAAVNFISARPIGREAVDGGWHVPLIRFVQAFHRVPTEGELRGIKAEAARTSAALESAWHNPITRAMAMAMLERRERDAIAIREWTPGERAA